VVPWAFSPRHSSLRALWQKTSVPLPLPLPISMGTSGPPEETKPLIARQDTKREQITSCTRLVVSHQFTIDKEILFVIPTLLFDTEWKRYCSEGSTWEITGLAIRNTTRTTDYTGNPGGVHTYNIYFYQSSQTDINSGIQSACPPADLPTGAWKLGWEDRFSETFFGQNGFKTDTDIPLHSATDVKGSPSETTSQVNLPSLGGALFEIVPLTTPQAPNAFRFLKNASTESGRFTISEGAVSSSYSNVILALGSMAVVEWDLEVLATIKRIE